MAAAVRIRRRSRQRSQPAKDDVRNAVSATSEKVTSPKATPSKVIRFQEDQQQQHRQPEQRRQHQQQQLHHLNVEQQKQQKQQHQEEPQQLGQQELHQEQHPQSNILEEHQILQPQEHVQQQQHEERENQPREPEREPKSLKKSSAREEEEEEEEERDIQNPRPLFKRQNSYRAAQERNPIADQGRFHRFIILCHSAQAYSTFLNLSGDFVHPLKFSLSISQRTHYHYRSDFQRVLRV